ncbi:MAG: ABC transporter permease [Janthinobacterium lividum]
MKPLLVYTARRAAQALPTVAVIVVLNYVLLRLAPGDLVDVMAGESGSATPEYMSQLRHQFSLDLPPWQLFWHYLLNLAHFNLGFSFRYGEAVSALIAERLPATLLLMLSAVAVALVVGVALGVLAARYRGSVLDEAISFFSTAGFAMPLFWVGLMLIVLFSVTLRWLPSAGMTTIGGDFDGFWPHLGDVALHLILPAGTLALFFVAIYARMTRAAMLEVYGLDFVRTARAKGISESRVVVRHVLRNALLPIVTLTGLQLGTLLGGSVVVESVFAWPGLGQLAFDAVFQRDLNLLLGVFLCSSLLVIIVNLLVDVVYALLDPRIEVAR